MRDDDDRWDELRAEVEADMGYEQFFEDMQSLGEDNTRDYLGEYGDAIQERINGFLEQAKALHKQGYFGVSLVLSTIAIEIILRYFILLPLIRGVIFSDDWIDFITERILNGKSDDDRKLFVRILRLWDIDIEGLELSNGQKLWATYRSEIIKKRNCFVHKGDLITEGESNSAIECVETFMQAVVFKIAEILGFTKLATEPWRNASYTRYTESTPF